MLRLTTTYGRLSVLSCCERLFSQMSILEMVFYLVTTEILVCEISGRDDNVSLCNHGLGGFSDWWCNYPYWFDE